MPKHADDKDARGTAEGFLAEVTENEAVIAATLVNEFPIVEFETKTVNGDPGAKVTLRRIVMVGPWEVVK